MRLVVGIGNPGPEYVGTRHNVGFEVLDAAARVFAVTFARAGDVGWCAKGSLQGEPFLLLKPATYVNRSGLAAKAVCDHFQIMAEAVLVVLDDMALPPGRVRFRPAGSHGGHNGLRSVLDELRTETVPRIRIGIGSVPAEAWREHVLAPFSAEERPVIDQAVARAVDGVKGFLLGTPHERLAGELNRTSPGEHSPGTGDADSRSEGCGGPPDRGVRED